MGVIIVLPEAELRMFLQTVQSLVFQNNKNLVCRSLKEELVAVLLQCGFYRGCAVKGGFSDMKVQIIREKGTNRSQFFRGQVDKYTWRDIGSSYLMSDLQAAYLWAQLEAADRINQQRLALWQNYYDALAPLAKAGRIELPSIPDGCVQNAHMFYIKLRDIDDRSALINFLKEAEIMAVFHYIPLHGCPAGEHFGEFHGEDRYTTKESERLLRLPLFYNLSPVNQRTVIATLLNYFS